jgi:lipoprotein signal peptidase
MEWAAFLVLSLLRRDIDSGRELLVASWPLAGFYLVACALDAVSRRSTHLARGWRLPALVAGLVAADQLGKFLVALFLGPHSSVPIVEGWLHVAHEQNRQGSWLVGMFDLPLVGMAALAAAVVPVLLLSILGYRYYVNTKRRSVWADAAFVGLSAGLASWVCDVGLRGYVIDYIQLPGIVTADLKDILLSLGVAALVVETLDSPHVSWRWEGWRTEGRKLGQLLVGFFGFSVQQLRGIKRVLQRKSKE